jgi:hypothetical protein
LTPYFVKFANSILVQKEEVWVAFFGQLIASVAAILGALWVSSRQRKNEEIERVKSSITVLINDLKYISTRVKQYRENSLANEDNPHFYRVRYLNISDNWRDLVAVLGRNKVLKREHISELYDYFTDVYYITDKYNELAEYNSKSDNSAASKKLQIKKAINKKYSEMDTKYEASIKEIVIRMAIW